MRKIRVLLLAVLAFSPILGQASPLNKDQALHHLLDNISPLGTKRGVVIASPQRAAPDYYFHWTRDAALVMKEIIAEYEAAPFGSIRKLEMRHRLEDYAFFSLENQNTPAAEGLGEPKYHVDGRVFTGDWSRPQNDGPALRALTFLQWAAVLEREGNLAPSKALLQAILRTDLDYVAARWQLVNHDIWEETYATHFYTRMAQRKALTLGAQWMEKMGEVSLAQHYRTQAQQVAQDMDRFWSTEKNYILSNIDWQGGVNFKHSNLDSSVLLAALHSTDAGEAFSLTDTRVLATMNALRTVFLQRYRINQNGVAGIAIGRYPEDLYAGGDFSGGNPWPLLTAAYAEGYYLLAVHFLRERKVVPSQELNELLGFSLSSEVKVGSTEFQKTIDRLYQLADDQLTRIKYHSGENETLPEQFHRETGFAQSAADLTWSYAAVLSALRARATLENLRR